MLMFHSVLIHPNSNVEHLRGEADILQKSIDNIYIDDCFRIV